jgi:hypothetical protein
MPIGFPTPERQPSIAESTKRMKEVCAKRAARKDARIKRGRDVRKRPL